MAPVAIGETGTAIVNGMRATEMRCTLCSMREKLPKNIFDVPKRNFGCMVHVHACMYRMCKVCGYECVCLEVDNVNCIHGYNEFGFLFGM